MITNEQIEQFIAQAHRVGDAGLTFAAAKQLLFHTRFSVMSNRILP